MMHSLPDFPDGVAPRDKIKVRVREHHTYGQYKAGDVFLVPAQEWRSAHRCLEFVAEAADPTPETPTSRIVALPADVARAAGLPVPQGAVVLSFEMMPWPADAEAKGQRRREELEALVLHLQEGGAGPELREFAATFGWDEEDDGDATAFIKTRLPAIKKHFAEALGRAERAVEEAQRQAAAYLTERLAAADSAFQTEYESLRGKLGEAEKELKTVREELGTAQEELARLRGELVAAKAAAPAAASAPAAPDKGAAQEKSGGPPRGKAKE